MTVTVTPVQAKEAWSSEQSAHLLALLAALPNGVQAMSNNIPGLVETSLNLGQLRAEGSEMRATFSVRSSVNADKYALLDRMKETAERFGASFATHGHYPAWEYRQESPLRDLMRRVYKEQYGTEPQVVAIHAGVECGFFCEKLPGLDAVSFGPDLLDIHTPRERMNVASVERTYRMTCEILKRL